SFDNYFGRMGQYRTDRGFTDSFDGVPLNVSFKDANGKTVQPYHLRTVCTEDLPPGWNPTHLSVDGGKMDKFPVQTQNNVPSTIWTRRGSRGASTSWTRPTRSRIGQYIRATAARSSRSVSTSLTSRATRRRRRSSSSTAAADRAPRTSIPEAMSRRARPRSRA